MKKLIVVASLLCLSLPAQAEFPTKPLRAVVAFGTGGATDVIARIIAAAMTQSLGQPVVIDNRPGADGIIAGDQVVKAAPDGHTIFFATSTQVSALQSLRKSVPFDPIADMAAIGGIGTYGFFYAVNPGLPVRTMKELAEYGRANPDKLNVASSSASATIAPTLMMAAEKFRMQVIPYKSEATAINDLATGRVQVMVITGTLAQFVRDGRVRGLATLLPARSKQLPDLPTLAEAGMAPFPAVPWLGLFGPAKMPKEAVERLSRALQEVLQKPEVREQIERQAMDVRFMPAEAMGTLAREQTEVWKRITREAGHVPE